jgi:ELP3 family radical SAM enzyme/protein acetyltransferase
MSACGASSPADYMSQTSDSRSNPSDDLEDVAGFAAVTETVATNTKRLEYMIKDMLKMPETAYNTPQALGQSTLKLCKKYAHHPPGKRAFGMLYRSLMKERPQEFPYIEALAQALIVRAVRSDSGILNISVSMPPDKFSCKYNCHFCPNEPGMPRSYLSNEDVFRRAADVGFDTARQVWGRLDVLAENGHPIDKVEYRVLGGTFSCYDHAIADEYVRDLYFAANTYYGGRERGRGTIEDEQAINVMARVHVVGLGIETRPDEVIKGDGGAAEVARFRRYGVTRVELGVQHTDDALLRRVNRGHLLKHSKAAIRILKDYGFKIEMHIMTDLPGATPDGDRECYRQVLQADPDLVPDYLKDYPCLDVSFTKIKEWKAEGKWVSYSEATPDARDLKEVLIYRQSITPPWVRVNRIQRDFLPAIEKNGFLGYTSDAHRSNLAQLVKAEAEARGVFCQCIRCCEVRSEKFDAADVVIKIAEFEASGAPEYFLSAVVEQPDAGRPLLLGFCRLRLGSALEESVLPELRGSTAMIRELHVYGRVREVGKSANGKPTAQHLGLGKRLLAAAEDIARAAAYERMAIISGIGVRDYYRQRGYELRGTYMVKELDAPAPAALAPAAATTCEDVDAYHPPFPGSGDHTALFSLLLPIIILLIAAIVTRILI